MKKTSNKNNRTYIYIYKITRLPLYIYIDKGNIYIENIYRNIYIEKGSRSYFFKKENGARGIDLIIISFLSGGLSVTNGGEKR